jgi:hypothetical protein
VAAVELFVVYQLRRNISERHKLGLVAWLASMFAAYRIALVILRVPRPCGCLGNAFSWITTDPLIMQRISTSLFWFLLIGSYFLLLRTTWIRHSANESATIID